MSRSNNVDNFFQTDSNLEESARKSAKSKNTNGDPIKLQSKILAICADPTQSTPTVFIAESAGTIRRINLDLRKTTHTYAGPTSPLTSVCVSLDGKTLFAGCWDKTIWSWDIASRKFKRQYKGHTDFVKVVRCVNLDNKAYLLSGGSDSGMIVWDIATGNRVSTAKSHSRAVLDLAVDPESEIRPQVFSASSEPNLRVFELSPSPFSVSEVQEPILEHETSVNKLYFDADGDLWTASSDKTAKRLVRANNWKPDTELVHPDFVRDVVVHEQGGWVVTACRDEEVRVWDRASGDLYHTFLGHFEEVTALLVIGWTLVSVSIDATLRTWSLKKGDVSQARKEAEEEEEAAKAGKEKEKADAEPKAFDLDDDLERELAEMEMEAMADG